MQKWQNVMIQINWLLVNIKQKKKQFLFFFNIRRWLIMCRMIMISDCNVSKTDCIKFLGILVDQHTSRRTHLDNISKEVTKSLGILHKTQDEHDKNVRDIYFFLICPYIIYCNDVWGLAHAFKRNRLFVLEKVLFSWHYAYLSSIRWRCNTDIKHHKSSWSAVIHVSFPLTKIPVHPKWLYSQLWYQTEISYHWSSTSNKFSWNVCSYTFVWLSGVIISSL